MRNIVKVLTIFTAVTAGIMMSGLLYKVSAISQDPGEVMHLDVRKLLFAITIGFSLQIGLLISPIVTGRNILLRVLALSLMMPFIYFVLLQDIPVLVSDIFTTGDAWRMNFKSNLLGLILMLIYSVIYGMNIFLLIVSSNKSFADISRSVPPNG